MLGMLGLQFDLSTSNLLTNLLSKVWIRLWAISFFGCVIPWAAVHQHLCEHRYILDEMFECDFLMHFPSLYYFCRGISKHQPP
jgi:hypothetical protein